MRKTEKTRRIKWAVFLPPFLLTIVCVIYNFINSASFAGTMSALYYGILNHFGWMFLGGPLFMLFVLIWVCFTPLGNVVLGGKDAVPIFDKKTWYYVALCTTVACGIVFWAAAEPIQHYLNPPASLGIEGGTPAAATYSMAIVFNNWTLMPYAIYCVVTVMFAFAYYNMKKEYSLGSCLAPIVKEKYEKPVGTLVDIVCIFTLVAGLAASLGVGILNLNGALTNMFSLISSPFVWAVIIAVVTATFVVSSVSGVSKGIKFLSNFNVYVYGLILLLTLMFGGVVFILNFGMESIAMWLDNFFRISLFTGAAAKDTWAQDWPVFYMGNWAAWAPISGVFLAKISKGRTVKECILLNLFATALFSILWFMIISGATLNMVMNHPGSGLTEAFAMGYENVIYCLFDNLPLSVITKILFFVAVFVSFVTASDSTTVAISDLCCHSDKENPEKSDTPAFVKILWGVIISVLTWIMMSIGEGITGMKMLSNIGGLPALIFVLLITTALIRVAKNPKKFDRTQADGVMGENAETN